MSVVEYKIEVKTSDIKGAGDKTINIVPKVLILLNNNNML